MCTCSIWAECNREKREQEGGAACGWRPFCFWGWQRRCGWLEFGAMRSIRPRLFCAGVAVVWFLAGVQGYAALPKATSQSTITVSGPGLANGTYAPNQVNAEWFVTATDAHATLHMDTGYGTKPRVVLELEWDGKGPVQRIDGAAQHSNAPGGAGFYLQVDDAMAQPEKADVVTVTVSAMDAGTLTATVLGTARTGAGPVRVTGTIRLTRAVAARGAKTTEAAGGTFEGCDPVIHDKLAGAEGRSPTECEVKYDLHVRQALARALAPVVQELTAEHWSETTKPAMGPVTVMARHTEGHPYAIDNAVGARFRMVLDAGAGGGDSSQAQQARYQRMAELMKDMAKNQKEIEALSHEAAGSAAESRVEVAVHTNAASMGVANFNLHHTVSALPGGGVVVWVEEAQAETGGGEDAASGEMWVLLGPWGQPVAKALGDGGEQVSAKATLSASRPVMATQTVVVTIRASQGLAQRVIQRVDWGVVRGLMAER